MKIIYKEDSKLTKEKSEFLNQYNPEDDINISKTAESFGVSRQTIYNWIKSYKENQEK